MATSRIPRMILDEVGNQVASRTPGPLGYNDAASPFPHTKQARGDTPGPLGRNDHGDPNIDVKTSREFKVTAAKAWNRFAAAAYLKNPENGWARKDSSGKCAKAIRLAINAGHLSTPNNPVSAADYENYLPTLGFGKVGLETYVPEIGDVAVFPAVPGTKLVHGHIEMYTGEGWQSDYVQQGKPRDGKYGRGFFANQLWTTRPFCIFRKGEPK